MGPDCQFASSARPSGASCELPPDRLNVRAKRSFAAIRWTLVFQPPRDFPIVCGPFFGRASAVGMYFDRRAAQTEAINGHADHVMFLKRIEQTIQHTRICPTTHSGVNCMPIPKTRWQGPPFTSVFRDKQDGIDDCDVGNPHTAPLNRKVWRNQSILIFCYLTHNRELAEITSRQ